MSTDNDQTAKTTRRHKASIAEMFSTADWVDISLMATGAIAAAGNGMSQPIYYIYYYKTITAMHDSGKSANEELNQLAVVLVYIALCNFACGFLQAFCWTLAGERQAQKLRQ